MMKKFKTFIILFSLLTQVFAQSPQKLSYQAVIRNNANALISNAMVGIKISIIQGIHYFQSINNHTIIYKI